MSRRQFQFSLRALLVLITVIGVWVGPAAHRAHQQQAAVSAIIRLDGKVGYWCDYDPAKEVGTLLNAQQIKERAWINYIEDVRMVWLPGKANDSICKHIANLSDLQRLALEGSELTDVGLERLHRLSRLEELYLIETSATDAGVARLRSALPHCSINYPWPPRSWPPFVE